MAIAGLAPCAGREEVEMTIGVVGRKTGMTRVFTEEGVSVPVTVVQVEPNRVSQVKTVETDGYQAIQVTVGDRRAQHRVSHTMCRISCIAYHVSRIMYRISWSTSY